MRYKLHVSFMNFAALTLAIAVAYLSACVYQALITPTNMVIVGGSIKGLDGKLRAVDVVDNAGISIKKDEVLFVQFRVLSRKIAGSVFVNRIVIDSASVQFIVSTTARTWKAGDIQNVIGEFPVPAIAATGCKAIAFSQASYTFYSNILTYFVPVVNNSPVINLCIE